MTFAAAAGAVTELAVRFLGGDHQVTLRRTHSLNALGAPLATLKVSGAHLLGATSISLKATNLAGLVPAGMQFSIAGNAQVYTATADAQAASGVVAVSITPALVAAAAGDATVTITRAYGDRTLYALRGSGERGRTDEGRETEDRLYHLLPDGGSAPLPGDQVIDGDYTGMVASAPETNPGTAALRWSVPTGSTP